MKKLTLNLNDLRVVSFDALPPAPGPCGTVHGAGAAAREFYTDLNAYSCGSSCLGKCYASFYQPCDP